MAGFEPATTKKMNLYLVALKFKDSIGTDAAFPLPIFAENGEGQGGTIFWSMPLHKYRETSYS